MARNRGIKPDFFMDEKIGLLSVKARYLFIGLWVQADDSGVCRANSAFLKSNIFPYDDISLKEIQKLLAELSESGRILLGDHCGEGFLLVKNFLKHQKIDHPSQFRYVSGEYRDIFRGLAEDSPSTQGDLAPEVKVDVKVNEDDNENVKQDDDLTEVENFWNGLCSKYQGHHPIRKLSASRRKHLKARMTEPLFDDNWKEILEAAHKSDFLSGRKPSTSNPNFRGDLDWLISSDQNYVKVLEGKYKNKEPDPDDITCGGRYSLAT